MGEVGPSTTTDQTDRVPARRFAIGDAMILVALAACWLGVLSRSGTPVRIVNYARLAPAYFGYVYLGRPWTPAIGYFRRADLVAYLRSTPVLILSEMGLPWMALLTLAYPVFRLKGPRPPWRDLLRQPGTVAVLAIALAILIEVDLRWALGVTVPTPMPLNTGLAVALAWMVLGLTRTWKAEASWVDRLGLVLGVCWIAVGLAVATDDWAG